MIPYWSMTLFLNWFYGIIIHNNFLQPEFTNYCPENVAYTIPYLIRHLPGRIRGASKLPPPHSTARGNRGGMNSGRRFLFSLPVRCIVQLVKMPPLKDIDGVRHQIAG
jgi:hypothetical protein